MATAKKNAKVATPRSASSRPAGKGRRKHEPAPLDIQNVIRYTTAQPASVADVIASLEGMDTIVRKYLPKAVYELTGAKVIEAELLIAGIEEGSVLEDTIVRLMFGSVEEREQFLDRVRGGTIEYFKDSPPMVKGLIISGVVLSLVLLGLAYASQDAPQSGALANIKGDNNVVVVIGAEAYQTSPEAFQQTVEKAVTARQKKELGRAAMQFTAPARAENGAGIQIEGNGREVIALAPNTAASLPDGVVVKDTSFDRTYRKVRVNIRATDVDSGSRGWAGTINGIADTRTRLVFQNEADVGKVAYKPGFDADVSVTYAGQTGMAQFKPILIIVDKVL